MTAAEQNRTGRQDAGGSNLGMSGIVLGSADPDRLAAWYRSVLEPLGARWETHMMVIADGMYLGFDRRDDVADKAAETGRYMINFSVADIRAAERHLNSLHVRWIRPVEATEWGHISTVEDPDGNYLQFVHMTEEALAAMQEDDRES